MKGLEIRKGYDPSYQLRSVSAGDSNRYWLTTLVETLVKGHLFKLFRSMFELL